MPRNDKPTFQVDDAQLLPPPFKNFTGRKTMYNREGDRNFCIILDPEFAATLANDGWAVKWLDPREEGDEPTAYIKVTVKFGDYPPRITMISSAGKTLLDEDTVEVLDYTYLQKVDLICRAYDWTLADGRSGRAAYLQTMFVTIEEDALERKYALMERESRQQRDASYD